MKYGYTVADKADEQAFASLVGFVESTLHYKRDGNARTDVDGSMMQTFTLRNSHIKVESDVNIDYVAVISDVPLAINCLHKWTE